MTYQPSHVRNIDELDEAVTSYYSNQQVNEYNNNKLLELNQPIATINTLHSHKSAASISSDKFSGLESVISLTNGAKVMLTMNLCTEVGLCNGATETVIHIVFKDGQRPPDLPITVIVQFKDYNGPSFSQESCVPICLITVSADMSGIHYEPQQLPLRLAWTITIHKSQRLTLEKAWIDLGKSERVAGMLYVALSRVKNLLHGIIEPMPFKRLQSITKSKTFAYRVAEEERLMRLTELPEAFYSAQ